MRKIACRVEKWENVWKSNIGANFHANHKYSTNDIPPNETSQWGLSGTHNGSPKLCVYKALHTLWRCRARPGGEILANWLIIWIGGAGGVPFQGSVFRFSQSLNIVRNMGGKLRKWEKSLAEWKNEENMGKSNIGAISTQTTDIQPNVIRFL